MSIEEVLDFDSIMHDIIKQIYYDKHNIKSLRS